MEEDKNIKNKISTPLAIIISAVLIAAAILFSKKPTTVDTGRVAQGDKLDMVEEVSEKDFLRGSPDADIVIIEYADFSCGYCGIYHPTLSKIIEEYKGRVSWVYRHLPIFNIDAAVASQCVGEIGGDEKFWSFSDTLYQNRSSFSLDYYKQTALSLGILEEEYDACVSNPLTKSSIQRDFSQNKILLGFNATPYSVVIDKNGKKFSFAGALPYEDIKSLLDKLLQ